jgi:hypothetical protein
MRHPRCHIDTRDCAVTYDAKPGSERRFPGLDLESVIGNLPELLMAHLNSAERIAIIFEVELDRYVQCLATEDHQLIVECISNRFLREDQCLSIDEECALLELGFQPPELASEPHPNFWWLGGTDLCEIMVACRMISTVLKEVFNLRRGSLIEIIERPLARH